ncbi:hypothetical protein CLD20_02655 [Afifella sp. IM 167]|nr:hypothetical protein [Afifella sp. IM 167]
MAAGTALAICLAPAAFAQTDTTPQDENAEMGPSSDGGDDVASPDTDTDDDTMPMQQAGPGQGWGPGSCPAWGQGPAGRNNWQPGAMRGPCGPGMRGQGMGPGMRGQGMGPGRAMMGPRGGPGWHHKGRHGMGTSFVMRKKDAMIRVDCSPRETAEACVDAAIRLIEATRDAAPPAPGN